MMALRKFLILRSPRSGRLEGRMMPIQPRRPESPSGPDLDRRPVGDRVPDLEDREIADRDAPLGPIAIPLRRIERAVIRWQAMHKDRAARLDTDRGGALAVALVGIGNVQRAGVAALQ